MAERPILTALDDRIYGETPEDGLIARVYGDPELATLFASAPDLLGALERVDRLIKEALPKFDWGRSALDNNAIQLLNEVPIEVTNALLKARG